jgi:hypothetical protein
MAATIASPAEAPADPATMPGAYSAARASGPPNDVTATPAKAQALTGRVPAGRGGRPALVPVVRPALVPVVRVGKVVIGAVSSSRRRRSSCPTWQMRTAPVRSPRRRCRWR